MALGSTPCLFALLILVQCERSSAFPNFTYARVLQLGILKPKQMKGGNHARTESLFRNRY